MSASAWDEALDLSAAARRAINQDPRLLGLLHDLDLLPEQLLAQSERTPDLVKAYHRLYGVLYAYRGLVAPELRTGDTVVHEPTDETWVVAYDDPETGVCGLGWPDAVVPRHECRLVARESDAGHCAQLRALVKSGDRRAAVAVRLYGDPGLDEAGATGSEVSSTTVSSAPTTPGPEAPRPASPRLGPAEVYKAEVSFVVLVDGQSFEKSYTIHYTAASPRTAALDARRWAANRQDAIPDYFGRLACVKVYAFAPRVLDASGYLGPATFMPLFEWKCDRPGTYEDYLPDDPEEVSS